jgi:hypothetical protein
MLPLLAAAAIGLERDSFFQVDNELLVISFKNDLVSKVEIAQG